MQVFWTASVVLSLVFTVLLNVALRFLPRDDDGPDAFDERGSEPELERESMERERVEPPRLEVWFPWKAMLIVGVLLTVLVNLFLLAMP